MLGNAQLMGFVPTRDPAVARAFYEHVLGLRFLWEDGFAVTVESNGIRVRLTKIENHKPLPFTILGWEIPNVEKAVSDLESRGVVFEKYGMPNQDARGIWTAPGGSKIAWFKDPDGNVLSLAELA